MLDQIISTITKKVGDRLTTEVGLTQKQAQESITIAGESAVHVIQEEAAKGKTSELTNLFNKDTAERSQNPIFSKIETLFLTKLSSSLNISGTKASSIKDLILPYLIKTIGQSSKVGDTFDISTLRSLIQPGKGSLGEKLGGFFKKP
jgi:hypothetical protein